MSATPERRLVGGPGGPARAQHRPALRGHGGGRRPAGVHGRQPALLPELLDASAKAIADAAHGAAEPGLVTAIGASNRSLGVRVSRLGDRWFLADAPVGTPKLFPGYALSGACPAMGDSYLTEVVGLGAFALVAAPALSRFTGGDPRGRPPSSTSCAGSRARPPRWLIPSEGFAGTPIAIDVARVQHTGVAPLVNNGLAHRTPGVGQVGAGLTACPWSPSPRPPPRSQPSGTVGP
jgi:hypothetical protein